MPSELSCEGGLSPGRFDDLDNATRNDKQQGASEVKPVAVSRDGHSPSFS